VGSTRHRIRLLRDGTSRCSASFCTFTGTSGEVVAHIRYGITRRPDGSWSGPANLTAASLPDLMAQLGVVSA
jgi:hypothetical protein